VSLGLGAGRVAEREGGLRSDSLGDGGGGRHCGWDSFFWRTRVDADKDNSIVCYDGGFISRFDRRSDTREPS
jgi:hypothetical protein